MRRVHDVIMGRARKKAQAKPSEPIKTVGIRSTPKWAKWLQRAATFCRTDTSKLIDAALVAYMKALGFGEDPPPRL